MLDKSPNSPSVNVPNDLAAHWMPFTANRAFKKAPRLLAGAKDPQATFPLANPAGGSVRVVVTDGAGRKAWVQPVRVP